MTRPTQLTMKLALAAVLSFVVATAASAEETIDGAQLAETKGCVTCHGANGRGTAPIYPNLHGQWTRYLRLQLMAYRSGKRQNAIMNGFASGLTEAEIRALADHYGR